MADADDSTLYYGVIEVNMDDIVDLSAFYGNNQPDDIVDLSPLFGDNQPDDILDLNPLFGDNQPNNIVEFEKDVKSEELKDIEKKIEELSKKIKELEEEKKSIKSTDLRFRPLKHNIEKKNAILQKLLKEKMALIQADEDEDKENQHRSS